MKLAFEKTFRPNLLSLMRSCGYVPEGVHNGQENFTRKLGSLPYPHFHIYIHEYNLTRLVFTIHLDQKKPSYRDNTAHSGEYESPLVMDEARRLTGILQNI